MVEEEDSPRIEESSFGKQYCPYCESEKLYIKKNKFSGRILGMSKDGVLEWYPNLKQAKVSAEEVFKSVVYCSDCGEVFQISQYRPHYKRKP
jgi:uncharacterized protein YbaR (Trm112 family)|tara:strand:+ start:458 stop:733 length:276 start_codon:yes stop_codon:yes gene_type:complete